MDLPDYRVYLDWLAEGAAAHGCGIHAYVLMTNHIHLLMTPNKGGRSATRSRPSAGGSCLTFTYAHIDPEMLSDVRACLQPGTPLGNDRFRLQIEQALGVKVVYGTRERPKNPPAGPSQDVDQIELDI